MTDWGWYRILLFSDHITQIALAVIEYGKRDDLFQTFCPESFDAAAAFVGEEPTVMAECVTGQLDMMRDFNAIERHTWSGSGHGTYHWREPMGCQMGRTSSHWRRELAFAAGRPHDRWTDQAVGS